MFSVRRRKLGMSGQGERQSKVCYFECASPETVITAIYLGDSPRYIGPLSDLSILYFNGIVTLFSSDYYYTCRLLYTL